MKIKSFIRIALVACIFWVAAGCDGLTPSTPNLYIAIDDGTHHAGFTLRYLAYVKPRANGHSSKNIVGERKGTIEFKGMTYEYWSIPRAEWDLYYEWNTNYRPDDWYNERTRVNLKLNDWVRIYWNQSSSSGTPESYQGSGELR